MELLNSYEFWYILAALLGFAGIIWTIIGTASKMPPDTIVAVNTALDTMEEMAKQKAFEKRLEQQVEDSQIPPQNHDTDSTKDLESSILLVEKPSIDPLLEKPKRVIKKKQEATNE